MGGHARTQIVGIILLLFAVINPAVAEPRRVLLLHSFGPQFVPWTYFSGQFREALIKQSPNAIDLYEASLESARFARLEEQGPVIEYLRSLLAERKPDLIVTMGAPAALFVQRYRPQFFPSTPLIMGAVEQRSISGAALTANDTAVSVSYPSLSNTFCVFYQTRPTLRGLSALRRRKDFGWRSCAEHLNHSRTE